MSGKSTRTHRSLADTFDVEDVVDLSGSTKLELSVVPVENPTVDDDVTTVRDTLTKLLEQGAESFEDLKRIAVAEESPRAFEVLNTMLSTLSDISIRLLEVHERKAKIDKLAASKTDAPAAINNGSVTNNNLFVGTTADLQAMIRNLTKDPQ